MEYHWPRSAGKGEYWGIDLRYSSDLEGGGNMFEGESSEHSFWEGSGYGRLIVALHSVPHRWHLIISVDHVIRIRNVKCLLWFGCEEGFTHALFLCGTFGSQLPNQWLRSDGVLREGSGFTNGSMHLLMDSGSETLWEGSRDWYWAKEGDHWICAFEGYLVPGPFSSHSSCFLVAMRSASVLPYHLTMTFCFTTGPETMVLDHEQKKFLFLNVIGVWYSVTVTQSWLTLWQTGKVLELDVLPCWR